MSELHEALALNSKRNSHRLRELERRFDLKPTTSNQGRMLVGKYRATPAMLAEYSGTVGSEAGAAAHTTTEEFQAATPGAAIALTATDLPDPLGMPDAPGAAAPPGAQVTPTALQEEEPGPAPPGVQEAAPPGTRKACGELHHLRMDWIVEEVGRAGFMLSAEIARFLTRREAEVTGVPRDAPPDRKTCTRVVDRAVAAGKLAVGREARSVGCDRGWGPAWAVVLWDVGKDVACLGAAQQPQGWDGSNPMHMLHRGHPCTAMHIPPPPSLPAQVLSVNIPSKHGCLQNRAQLVLAPPETVPDEAFVTRVFRHCKAYSHHAHSRGAPNSVASLAAKAMDMGAWMGWRLWVPGNGEMGHTAAVGGCLLRCRSTRAAVAGKSPVMHGRATGTVPCPGTPHSAPNNRTLGTPLPQVESKGLLGLSREGRRHPGLDLAAGSEVDWVPQDGRAWFQTCRFWMSALHALCGLARLARLMPYAPRWAGFALDMTC